MNKRLSLMLVLIVYLVSGSLPARADLMVESAVFYSSIVNKTQQLKVTGSVDPVSIEQCKGIVGGITRGANPPDHSVCEFLSTVAVRSAQGAVFGYAAGLTTILTLERTLAGRGPCRLDCSWSPERGAKCYYDCFSLSLAHYCGKCCGLASAVIGAGIGVGDYISKHSAKNYEKEDVEIDLYPNESSEESRKVNVLMYFGEDYFDRWSQAHRRSESNKANPLTLGKFLAFLKEIQKLPRENSGIRFVENEHHQLMIVFECSENPSHSSDPNC